MFALPVRPPHTTSSILYIWPDPIHTDVYAKRQAELSVVSWRQPSNSDPLRTGMNRQHSRLMHLPQVLIDTSQVKRTKDTCRIAIFSLKLAPFHPHPLVSISQQDLVYHIYEPSPTMGHKKTRCNPKSACGLTTRTPSPTPNAPAEPWGSENLHLQCLGGNKIYSFFH